MELGIKGHETRGDEIIEILETLGGNNCYNLTGIYDNKFYYIRKKFKNITNSYIGPDEIKGYKIFSLEDFLEKYPYKVGDKVNIYVQNDDIEGWFDIEVAEITSMRWDPTLCRIVYKMKDINREFCVEDIKGKVYDDDTKEQSECEQCGRVFGSVRCFDVDCPSNMPNYVKDYTEIDKQCFDEVHKRYSEITHVYLTGYGYTLPDGFHLVDENGKAIDASKIKLVKNAPYYPTTYNECCDVLNTHVSNVTRPIGWKENLISKFQELLICRDAYWKIAGDELGLGKPWEPDFSDDSPKYNIFKYENGITLSDNNWSNRILVFPTIEMRNTFYENFKELIEQCKELL